MHPYGVDEKTIFGIGDFTINWNLFEHYYLNNNGSMDAIANMDLCGFDYSDTPNRFRSLLILYIMKKGDVITSTESITESHINSFLFPSGKGTKYVPAILSYIKGDNDDIHNCLLCICRLRNNLLHGEKEIWTINEQCELISAATDVLTMMTNYSVYERWSKNKIKQQGE